METGKKATRQQIIDQARTWLNTPFKHQGRLKGVGVDCVGLVMGVANELDIYRYEYKTYHHSPNPEMMAQQLSLNLDEIVIQDAKVGDILWFRVMHHPRHLAIQTDLGIIHAFAPARKVVEIPLDIGWVQLLHKVYRYRGVID